MPCPRHAMQTAAIATTLVRYILHHVVLTAACDGIAQEGGEGVERWYHVASSRPLHS